MIRHPEGTHEPRPVDSRGCRRGSAGGRDGGAARRFPGRRVASAWAIVVALVLAACGSGVPAADAPEQDHVAAARAMPDLMAAMASTSLPEPPAEVDDDELEPWEVLVAVARPEISRLEAFDEPGGEPATFGIPLRNPWFFGGELVLLVEEGRRTDEWLKVLLPVRPNGTTAWIRTADVELRSHRMHAEVSLSDHRLRVWEADELLVETTVVLGSARTPTPPGRFYVNALVESANPRGAYGPWILPLSGYSEALETFNGGIPTLAIHGTNRPDLVGQYRSNGCVRIPNDVVEELAAIVPLGMPVEIVA